MNSKPCKKFIIAGGDSDRSKICVRLSDRFDEPQNVELDVDENAECSSSKKQKLIQLVAVQFCIHLTLRYCLTCYRIFLQRSLCILRRLINVLMEDVFFVHEIPFKPLLVWDLLPLLISCNQRHYVSKLMPSNCYVLVTVSFQFDIYSIKFIN